MKTFFYLIALFAFHYSFAQKIQRFEVLQGHWLIVHGLVHFDDQGQKTDTVYFIDGIDSRYLGTENKPVAGNTIPNQHLNKQLNYIKLHQGRLSDLLAFLQNGSAIYAKEDIGVCIDKNGNRFCIDKVLGSRTLTLYPFNVNSDTSANDYMNINDDSVLPWCADAIKQWAKKNKVTIR